MASQLHALLAKPTLRLFGTPTTGSETMTLHHGLSKAAYATVFVHERSPL